MKLCCLVKNELSSFSPPTGSEFEFVCLEGTSESITNVDATDLRPSVVGDTVDASTDTDVSVEDGGGSSSEVLETGDDVEVLNTVIALLTPPSPELVLNNENFDIDSSSPWETKIGVDVEVVSGINVVDETSDLKKF